VLGVKLEGQYHPSHVDSTSSELSWLGRGRPDDHGSVDNVIAENRFTRDHVGIELRGCLRTCILENDLDAVGEPIRADAASKDSTVASCDTRALRANLSGLPGKTTPVGARAAWGGRQHIIMTPWGPKEYE
jgi:hypothetical protein